MLTTGKPSPRLLKKYLRLSVRGWCGGKRQPPPPWTFPTAPALELPRSAGWSRETHPEPASREEGRCGRSLSLPQVSGFPAGPLWRPDLQGRGPPLCPQSARFLFFLVVTGGTEGGREPLSAWASLTLSL